MKVTKEDGNLPGERNMEGERREFVPQKQQIAHPLGKTSTEKCNSSIKEQQL